jgi:hypothetical protein
MPGTLRSLAWVTLALTGGTIAVLTLWQCDPNAAGGDLGCFLGKAQILLLTVLGSCITAPAVGITACRAEWRSQRGGWLVVFLLLTMLLVAAPTLILIILNVPVFQSMVNSSFLLLWAVFLLPPALALLTLVYLKATATRERGQTAPVPSGE